MSLITVGKKTKRLTGSTSKKKGNGLEYLNTQESPRSSSSCSNSSTNSSSSSLNSLSSLSSLESENDDNDSFNDDNVEMRNFELDNQSQQYNNVIIDDAERPNSNSSASQCSSMCTSGNEDNAALCKLYTTYPDEICQKLSSLMKVR